MTIQAELKCVTPILYLKTKTTEFRIRSYRKLKADLMIKYTQLQEKNAGCYVSPKDGLINHQDMKTDIY